MDRRPTYGLFVNTLEDEYQNKVLAGVEETARKHGLNVLCFVGGEIGSPTREGARRNFLYELAGPHLLEGLVVLGGTLANYVGLHQLARFVDRFRTLPMVSVGADLEGTPSILVDNARGMHAMVTHLVHVHGFRRVAFIRGPSGSEEAESRFAAYRQVLEDHGVALDPALFFEGDFTAESGAAAVNAFLDDRGVGFEAIVAASDAMAMGAIDALQGRGIRVPYDVAVVGFDDIESARFATAPLTTVRQPLYEMGVHAIEYLLAQSRGEPVPPRTVLRTQLISRQSCGCSPMTSIPLAQIQLLAPAESLVATFQYHRQRILSDIGQAMRAMSGSLEPAWGERLLDALVAEFDGVHAGVFLSTLEEVAATMATLGGNVIAWHGAMAVLRHHARACIQVDPERWARAEELWHDARVLVGLVAERAQGQQRLVNQRADRTLRIAAEDLATATDVGAVARILDARLPQLRIRSYALAVFEDAPRPGPLARLVGARTANGTVLNGVSDPFPARGLVPHLATLSERRSTYVVEPVFHESEAIGYLMLEMGPTEGVFYEMIRDYVGSALRGTSAYQSGIAEEGVTRGSSLPRLPAPSGFRAPGLRAAAGIRTANAGPRDHHDFVADAAGAWIIVGRITGDTPHVDRAHALVEGTVAAVLGDPRGATPGGVLRAVNAVLYTRLRGRAKAVPDVRLLVVRYAEHGRLQLAGAEGWLLVLHGEGGSVRVHGGSGPPLGTSADLAELAGEIEVALDDGDLLLVTTAGESVDGRMTLDALATELHRLRFETIDQIRDRLLEKARARLGSRDGDVSLLAARYGVSEDTLSLDEATNPGR